MKTWIASSLRLGLFALVAALVIGCTPSEREQQLQATVDALAAQNATLASAQTPAAQPGEAPAATAEEAQAASGAGAPAAPPRATPANAVSAVAVAPPEAAATPVQPQVAAAAVENPIPREIGRVVLVGDETSLADFRLDAAANTAYVTDAAYVLHVVDLNDLKEVASFPVSGERLLLDAPNGRLYIMPDAPWARTGISPTVTVFDTTSRTTVGELPGSRVGVDSSGDRLYIGDDVGFYSHAEQGVRLYDAATLTLVRTGAMAGNPLYNPAADELIIQGPSVWTADPDSLVPRVDLYSEITNEELPGCNGCPAAVDAYYFASAQIVAIQTTILSPQGAGRVTPADLYNAGTMERLPESYQMGATCSSQPQLRTPLDGRVVRVERYSRYVTYNNLILEDTAGKRLMARDGLWVSFVNPDTNAGYLQPSSTTSYVLDMATLAPVGMMDSICIFAGDDANGRLYATDAFRSALVVLEPTGGESNLPAAQADTVADKQVTSIVVSPDFAKDGTLYLVAWTLDEIGGQAILRSTDGGQTYTRLGGLPVGEELALTLAISPDFASDKTLFAGGARRELMGEGVWKSGDGGETWTPVWNGLSDLRVNRIEISPRYRADQTLLAWAAYTQVTPFESGYAMQRSTDGGLGWTRVITADSPETLPAASVYLPPASSAELPVRKDTWYGPIEVRIDSTRWTTATNAIGQDDILRGILSSPEGAGQAAIFVATDGGLYRTLDDGATWSRLAESEAGSGATMAAAITPLMGDGSYRLLLATADGELLQMDPNTVTWKEIVETTAPAPSATAESAQTDREVEPTPSSGLSGEPPAGLYRPTGIFGPRWEGDGALQESMGYARSEQPNSVAAAYQYFEHGVMVWRSDTRQVYAIYDDGTWDLFDDTFVEGEAESDPALRAPSGLMQPVRGFGKVWRSDDVVRERLGWAIAKEAAINALIQDFEHGAYVRADAIEAALIQRPAGREWVK